MSIGNVSSLLEAAGHRATPERAALARLVAAQGGAFTPAALLAEARRQRLRVGRATLFRALDLFGRLGLVERVDMPDGRHAYVTCSSAAHHHLVCSSCGKSTEVGELDLTRQLAELGERTGFRIDLHRVELFGVCPDCLPAGRI